MTLHPGTIRSLTAALAMAVLLPAGAAGQTFFTARLTTDQASADVESDARGTAALALTAEGLRYFITVDGLSGAVANAHFHRGPVGVPGDVVHGILDSFDGPSASGIWTATDAQPLTDELVAALLGGDLYLNIHTASYPSGEVRGQVLPTSGTGFSAALSAEEETHDVTSDGSGTAFLQLTDAGLLYFLTVTGLTGDVAAAHFHAAAAGEDGGVVRGITDDFVGNTAVGLWTAADDQPFTPDLTDALRAGGLYLNVHTAAYPSGEIRGQVLPMEGTALYASLTNEQEPGGVVQDASGTAWLTLTTDGLQYRITVDGLSGPITGAHFHAGAAGTNGGVVHAITGSFEGGTAAGTWSSLDDEPLTEALVDALLLGGLYVNVHTDANPGGEIRGQVRIGGGTGAAVQLDADQQPDPVVSDGSGTASLTRTDAGLIYELTVSDLTGDVVAAHFHQAPLATNGDVVRGITDSFDGNTAAGVWRSTDADSFTPALSQAFDDGELYLNVHTMAHPGGEIRGQVGAGAIVATAATRDERPTGFTLSQNYPNPFNPATTIAFDLPRTAPVTLVVYDITGRRLATLLDGVMTAGRHRVLFEAGRLPGGVYVYRLTAGPFRDTRSMLLIK